MSVTQARLKELLHYNRSTGLFTWKVRRGGKAAAGTIAGRPSNGYIGITIDGTRYQAHRLAWLYVHGSMPAMIDHRDRNRSNNAIRNLRDCKTHSCNGENLKARGSLEVIGVTRTGYKAKPFKAQIAKDKVHYFLGTFKTLEEASAAYRCAKRKLHKFNPTVRG